MLYLVVQVDALFKIFADYSFTVHKAIEPYGNKQK